MDKNLYGVSGQVTASGVLAFGHIFAALHAGNEHRQKTPQKKFARTRVGDQPQTRPKGLLAAQLTPAIRFIRGRRQ
ncbi:hypothetical protein [Mycobacterium sp.]|uniref:hypothetical protein n=1 Tax=Mycobacterium sp. TaxID=1785 RepID=UPI003C71AA9D